MVAPDTLRKLLKSNPFVPFKIQLSDGGLLEVTEADSVFLPPQWKSLLVTHPRGLFDFVPLEQVQEVVVDKPNKRAGKPRKPKE